MPSHQPLHSRFRFQFLLMPAHACGVCKDFVTVPVKLPCRSPFIVCALLVFFRGAYVGLDVLLIQKIPELLIIQISFQITGIILCLHGILQNTDPVRHSKQIIMHLIVKAMLV